MEGHSRRHGAVGATLAGAISVLLLLPVFSSAELVEEVEREVERTVAPTQDALQDVLTPPAQRPARAPARQPAQTPGQGTYQPPLHGANPHGQGTVTTVDVQPSDQRPLSGDPTGASDPGQAREEVIVGRARGEQEADGSYHGHITIVSLFGNEVLGVDTQDGQTAAGPLDAIQQGILKPLCDGSSICLEVLRANSSTTPSGSTNSFAVANLTVGDDPADPADSPAVAARAAESNGNISSDGQCQTAHGDSTVADADLGGNAVADVAHSSTDSRACQDGTQTQENNSSVIGLGGQGVPLPVAGCADGTPDSAFTPLAPLASIVCNADDTNGAGEAVAQTTAPYGVREALTVFAIEAGGTALLKTTTAASESHAVAPAAPVTPPDTSDNPECSDGIDNDGDGLVDFPADPDCSSPEDDSEAGPARPREEDDDDDDGGDGTARDEGAPECSDGIDNDGDGDIDFPNDEQCDSREDDSEAGGDAAGVSRELPLTGAELLLIALLGSITLAGGLALRRATEGWAGRDAA